MLINRAKQIFAEHPTCTELRVDSAYSAAGWYIDQGFQKIDPTQEVVAAREGYADTNLVIRKKPVKKDKD